ncbi:retrovirus-related pol polyprotein from transposon TNT 1-94 [Tanacetum coccineum]
MLFVAECGKCVFNSNHDACVSRYLKVMNARTKKPHVVPISASKPKRKANKSVATPHKKTVASDTTIQKSKSYYKKLYENTNQEWKWWIAKRCPSGYTWTQKIWMPKIRKDDESTSISPTIDNVSRITNVLKISNSLGSNLSNVPSSSNSLADCTVHFGNDQFAPILGYGDLIQGNVTIKRVYYVEGLNHNLFSVGQFCDADLETLHAYFKEEGIEHQTSTPRTPEQNGVVERRNRTLVEAARTMLSASKLPLSFWAEAVATACYTQNRSIIISTHGKTAYHIINDKKPHKTSSHLCCISRGISCLHKRTRLIVESIHIKFDEIKDMMSDHNSSDPYHNDKRCLLKMSLQASFPSRTKGVPIMTTLTPPPRQKCVPSAEKTDPVTTRMNFIRTRRIRSDCNSQQRRRLVAKGYVSEKVYDFEESFEPLLAWNKGGFMCSARRGSMTDHPEKVYLLRKALYGLKQAPRAWYDELSNFLMSKGFTKGTIDPTLFKIKYGEDILLVQIYVDDIIFGVYKPKSQRFEKLMHSRFEMSLMGEMKFFLGLQIHQSPKGIFINQANRASEYVALSASCAQVMRMRNDNNHDYGFNYNKIPLIATSQSDSGFELTAFSDADHAGCLDTRKSTSGGLKMV